MFAIFLTDGMDPFYQNIASFPTAIFTLVLGVTLLYWLVAVLGLVDIDILDFDIPDLDSDLDINPDSGLSNANVLSGLMLRFGLQGVPVTIIISFMALIGWLICYYLVHFSFAFIPEGILRYLAGLPILLGSIYGAAIITGQVIKPLRPLFQKATQETVKLLLGQTAIVRTSVVDNQFGEATLADGGAGLILKVRALGDAKFSQGDRIVLLEYDKDRNCYHVISEQEFTSPSPQ